MALRTSFSMHNLNLYREETKPDGSHWFLELVNLQDKEVHIANVSLNITGSFILTERPMNVKIENIKADLVKMHTLYSSANMHCNYPEAFVTPSVYFTNFSFVNSNIFNRRAPTDILRLNEVGNVTAYNID